MSFYDTTPLKATLERLVDFDRINACETRFSVGAVNVRTGNFIYFDSNTHHIGPEHVMASGSLPPGFPATEIDGEYYWDGGLVSNTPLQWVLDSRPRQDTLAFQVDLWSARGELAARPDRVGRAPEGHPLSSRTRGGTDQFRRSAEAAPRRRPICSKHVPQELRRPGRHELLADEADDKVYNIIQLIYHAQELRGRSKDYEFSRRTMEEHWQLRLQRLPSHAASSRKCCSGRQPGRGVHLRSGVQGRE